MPAAFDAALVRASEGADVAPDAPSEDAAPADASEGAGDPAASAPAAAPAASGNGDDTTSADDMCAICREDLITGSGDDELAMLVGGRCRHVFHLRCIYEATQVR